MQIFLCVVALGVLDFLVFLLNYCGGGGFKNLKLLEKIQKRFAVFADNLDRVIYSIWVNSKRVFTFKTHSLGNILQRRIQHKIL